MRKALQIIPILIFCYFWESAASSSERFAFYFGQPSEIAEHFYHRMFSGVLLRDYAVTFFEAIGGFLLGTTAGTLVGLIFWFSRPVFLFVRPYVIALGSTPVFALAPLLIIWFGTGFSSKLAIAAISTFFIALFQSYSGVEDVKPQHTALLKSLGATRLEIFRKGVVPNALVWVISGLKLSVGYALLGAFIGEFISSNAGLGHMIIVASGLFDISLVLLGVFLIVSMALLMTVIIDRIQQPLKRLIVRLF